MTNHVKKSINIGSEFCQDPPSLSSQIHVIHVHLTPTIANSQQDFEGSRIIILVEPSMFCLCCAATLLTLGQINIPIQERSILLVVINGVTETVNRLICLHLIFEGTRNRYIVWRLVAVTGISLARNNTIPLQVCLLQLMMRWH